MDNQITVEQFNKIYHDTYNDTLKFIVCKCSNIEDVNDIIQETYVQLHKILVKKTLENNNIRSYVFNIASNKIKKHYSLKARLFAGSLSSKNEEELELIDTISNDIDIENMIANEDMCDEIWEYIKTKKLVISKVFFLRFYMDLTIKEIANELEVSQSYVKNCLYRTLKEIREKFEMEESEYES